MTSPVVNVADHLARMAAEFPDRPAVHVPIGPVNPHGDTPHRTITFRELNADVDAIVGGLRGIGVGKGTRVAVMVPPGADFFALAFALLRAVAVPVLIDPGMGVKNLGKCLGEAEPEAFIGVPKAHLARRLFGWAKRSVKVTVNVGRGRFFCTRSLAEVRARSGQGGSLAPRVTAATLGDSRPPYGSHVAPTDLAAVLFTSGSTGVARGVEYTHGVFAAQVEALKATYGIAPGEVDLCTFPLFALFGPALGMACVVPDMEATRPATLDPHKAASQMRQFGVTNLFGSPAVIRRLADLAPLSSGGIGVGGERAPTSSPPLSKGGPGGVVASHSPPPAPPWKGGEEDWAAGMRLTTLKRAISAGAPASVPVIERFTKLLPPGVQVFTPYGATEALPVANIGSDEILGETRHATDQGRGVCVGRPVAGITVEIIRISDAPIPTWTDTLLSPPGEVGEIVVRGPVVTKRYFRRDEATALAKIVDPATGEVRHRMGDVGYFDDRGRLWFCGRKSHRVETPHGPLFTDMVEPVFNTVPGVFRTALVGVVRGGAMLPVLCIEVAPSIPSSPPLSKVGPGGVNDYRPPPPAPPWKGGEKKELPRITESLQSRASQFDHTRRIDTFLAYPGVFPVDVRHNSKIFREKLAAWADKQLGPKWNGGRA